MLAGRMFSHHNTPMVWASTARVIFQREARDEKEKQEGWLRVGRWVRVGSPLLLGVEHRLATPPTPPAPSLFKFPSRPLELACAVWKMGA